MHRGYFRLGIVLSVIWLAAVVAVVWYEFASRNDFCSTVADAACQHLFWSWVPVGKLVQFSLNTPRLSLVTFAPPIVGWLLGFAINWVRKGFRSSAT